ncbi:ATP-binding cassette domain-containing protein [Acidomonas methanolica]|uniref:ATP-binding cassette domain-containing protein n=1 Tax=Acidomonas methanolica TaxID=437 RepID=UPI00211A7BCE|nr:ATP-binding cassette domain-containing protein [Acidomonas methanolica]MCQ9155966.1 ATP-binding cassette domain-containing protein [Acidomonas methanolica]
MSAEAVLDLEHVTLAHGTRRVLEDATLVLPPGSVTLLRGCNGAGKTTLLRAMLGLTTPNAGRIRVLGRAPRAARRRIGYLPQSLTLPAPRLTGRALVTSARHGARFGVPGIGGRCRAAVQEALALVEAENLADQPLATLSGGERQRIGLAAALVDAPDLLLLDEPLAALDVQRQAALTEMLERLHQTRHLPLVLSVHGASPLDRLATHEVVLEDGHIVTRG